MDRKKFNKDLVFVGRVWCVAYAFATGWMLYFGEFNYEQCSVGSCIRKVTADSEPYLFYGTLIFSIINFIAGLYYGFIYKCKE